MAKGAQIIGSGWQNTCTRLALACHKGHNAHICTLEISSYICTHTRLIYTHTTTQSYSITCHHSFKYGLCINHLLTHGQACPSSANDVIDFITYKEWCSCSDFCRRFLVFVLHDFHAEDWSLLSAEKKKRKLVGMVVGVQKAVLFFATFSLRNTFTNTKHTNIL